MIIVCMIAATFVVFFPARQLVAQRTHLEDLQTRLAQLDAPIEPHRVAIRTLDPVPTPSPTPVPVPTVTPSALPAGAPTAPPVPPPSGATISSAAGTQKGAPNSFCWSTQVGGPSQCYSYPAQ